MRHITALLGLLAVFSLGQCHYWGRRPRRGDSCTVQNPARCEEPESVTKTVEPAGERFGPNVCATVTMETVSVADYAYERRPRCSRFYCSLRCARTDTCTVRNVTSTVYDCCAGFGARSSGHNHGFGYGRVIRHPGYYTLRRVGCTVELAASVAECLENLGLTELQTALEGSDLGSRLNSTDSDEEFTVFAPTNEAINGFLTKATLEAHVLDEVVRNSELRSFAVFQPLNENTLLHVTDVHKFRRFRFTEETFINGAEVNTSDACLAENGIVHTVNSVIPSSPDSIAELLANDPQFSEFMRLLDATNITRFLQAGRNTSRTVFAPSNNAFPEGAVDCLLRPENKAKALKLVLLHITAPVEYTSSLSQRSVIDTFSCRRYRCIRLLVCVINGTIHLTRGNVPLSDIDRTARNGVIHTVEKILLGDRFDFDELCPPEETSGSPPSEEPTGPLEPSASTPPSSEPTASLPIPDDPGVPEIPA